MSLAGPTCEPLTPHDTLTTENEAAGAVSGSVTVKLYVLVLAGATAAGPVNATTGTSFAGAVKVLNGAPR